MQHKSTNLYYKDAKSDKVYKVSLEKEGDLFIVNYAYGKRGGNLKEGTKTKAPVAYDKALAVYEKLVNSKTDKGYKETGVKDTSTKKAPKKSTSKKETKKSTKKAAKKVKSDAKKKARDTDVLFKEIVGFLKSKKSPVKFLNTINEEERKSLRPLVKDYMSKNKLLKRDLATGIHQIAYSFIEFTANESEADYWYIDEITEPEVIDDLIANHCPDWLEKVSTLEYLDRMRYVKDGHLNSPFVIDKSKNKNLLPLMSGYDSDNKDPLSYLYKHKESLEDHIWYLFNNPSNMGNGYDDIWTDIFLELIAKKKISRKKVITTIQEFKVSNIKGRGLYDRQYEVTNWVYKLLKALEPTNKELLKMQSTLIEYHNLDKAKTAQKYSIDFVTQIVSEKGFDVASCIKAISDIMESVNIPLSVKFIKLSSAILKEYPKQKDALVKALTKGQKNANKKVRDKLDIFFEKELKTSKTVAKKNAKLKSKKKPKGSLSDKQIEKVSSLLLSIDNANTKLALGILENQPFPEDLMTEIFLLYHTTPDEDIKKMAEGLIKEHGSQDLQKRRHSFKSLGTPSELESANENTIKKNIKKLVTGNELDGVKLANALYKKYGTGANYLLFETDKADQKEILQSFIKGSVINLSGLALHKFPDVIYDFPELTEMDLSNNNLITIPGKIKIFENLKVLNLKGNASFKSFHKNFGSLKKVEELYIDSIDFNHPLPDYFFDMDFKKLEVSTGTYMTVKEPPKGFEKLTNLTEFKMSNRMGTHEPIYSHYPNIDIVVKGNPLNMTPLELAKTALKQDNTSGNSFLINNGDSQIKKTVLESLYDKKTKTLDLSHLKVNEVPQEIKDFKVKHLVSEKSQLAFTALQTFPKHFSDLETIQFNYVRTKKTPDLSQFPNLKTLIFKDCELSEIVNLQSLKNLEKLDISNTDLETFPIEVFGLTKLTELQLFNFQEYGTENPKNIYDGLKNLKKLKSLTISEDDVTEEEFKTLLPKNCYLKKY